MPDTDTRPTCHPNVWDRLTKLMAARDNAKTQLKEQIDLRKEIKSELQELGAGNSDKHLRTSRKYVVCLESIEWYRAQLVSLANKIDAAIRAGIQGKFEFAEDDDFHTRPTEAEIFTPRQKGDEDDDDDDEEKSEASRHPVDQHHLKLPIGEAKAAAPAAQAPPGKPGPLDQRIADHPEVPGPLASKLQQVGVVTWRDFMGQLYIKFAEAGLKKPEKTQLEEIFNSRCDIERHFAEVPPPALKLGESVDTSSGEITKPKKPGRKPATAKA